MTPGRIVALVLVLLLAGLGFVNYAVNAPTEVQVLFKVPLVGAWAMAEPVSLPILLAAVFGGGALLSALGFGVRLAGASRRLRNVRRQVAALQEELDYMKRTAKEAKSAPKTKAPVGSPTPVTSKPSSGTTPAAAPGGTSDFDDLI